MKKAKPLKRILLVAGILFLFTGIVMTLGMPPIGILNLAIGGTMLFFALKKEKSPKTRPGDIDEEQTLSQQPEIGGTPSAAATDECEDDVIAAAMAAIRESEALMSAPSVAREFVQEPGQPAPEEAERLAKEAFMKIDWDSLGMYGKADYSHIGQYAERLYENSHHESCYYVAAAGSFWQVKACGNFYHGYADDIECVDKWRVLYIILVDIMSDRDRIKAYYSDEERREGLKHATKRLHALNSAYRRVLELPERVPPAPERPVRPVKTEKPPEPPAPERPVRPVETEKSPDPPAPEKPAGPVEIEPGGLTESEEEAEAAREGTVIVKTVAPIYYSSAPGSGRFPSPNFSKKSLFDRKNRRPAPSPHIIIGEGDPNAKISRYLYPLIVGRAPHVGRVLSIRVTELRDDGCTAQVLMPGEETAVFLPWDEEVDAPKAAGYFKVTVRVTKEFLDLSASD